MCIMEVRPNQHASTIQQACAHNVGTVVGDLDMFIRVMESRDPGRVPQIRALKAALGDIYEDMATLYGTLVAEEVEHLAHYTLHTAGVDHDHGNERDHTHADGWDGLHVAAAETARQVALADIDRARKYETR